MNIYEQIEADARNAAMTDTWGHLGPTPDNHDISMIMTLTEWGEYIVISSKHPTLEVSPWHYQNMNEMTSIMLSKDKYNKAKIANNVNDLDIHDGGVYKFEGTCIYGHEKEDFEDELTMRLSDCLCNPDYEDYDKVIKMAKHTNCHSMEEYCKKYSHKEINDILKQFDIDEIEAIHKITLLSFTGTITEIASSLNN